MDINKKLDAYKIPDPLASDSEKKSDAYGKKMAQLIEQEWFNGGITNQASGFMQRHDWIRSMRLFIRGENDTKEDKDWISRNKGDLEYINLDWTQLNLSQKFCKIVSNGIRDKYYNLDIRAFDPISIKLKQNRMNAFKTAMYAKPMLEKANEILGIDLTPKGFVPEDEEELNLYMEIKDRPRIEIAEEIMIDFVKKTNDWHNIEKKKNADLVEIGIASTRIYTDKNDGIKVAYVDPQNYGHSYVNDNNFKDAYYHFVVETITINDIKRESGFDDLKLREIAKKQSGKSMSYKDVNVSTANLDKILDMRIHVMRFAYKSSKTITYKKSTNKKGQVIKVSKRDDDFSSPANLSELKVSKTLDTWYEGNYILGANEIYGYAECENLVRDDMNKVQSPFITVATNIFENKLHSFLSDIKPICKQLQRQHLKIQQLIAELKPDLMNIDLDHLADLGSEEGETGKKREIWQEALNLLQTKGVVISQRVDMGELGMKDGAGATPMNAPQGTALAPLLNTWAFYYNLIRDITGVNPARDGSLPADALLGVNKMAELASNTATQHIVDAATEFNKKASEIISSRIHSIFKHDKAGYLKRMYENAVGKQIVDSLEVLADRNLHEFGFTIEMVPAQKELEEFAQDLGIAMQEGTIDVEDKIEAQRIARTNVKLANEYLKYRRRKRIKQKMDEQSTMAKEKSQNDIAAAQAAVQAKTQYYGLTKQMDLDYESKLSSIRLNELQQKLQIEAPEKEVEFQQEVYLENMKTATKMDLDKYKEDAKDIRLDRQASQNSKMITQRKDGSQPIDFENEQNFDEMFQN